MTQHIYLLSPQATGLGSPKIAGNLSLQQAVPQGKGAAPGLLGTFQ